MMELEECIKDATDTSMHNYINTEHYYNQRKNINVLLKNMRTGLSEEKSQLLNKLLDAISTCDGEYASEAYLQGVVDGMTLREKKKEP